VIVHASNEAPTVSAIRTLCVRELANRTNAWHYAMSRLDNTKLADAIGLTRADLQPILPRFDARVTCPLCRDAIRRKVAFLQQGLGTVERPELEGCGDSGCICRAPSGMATNGGCRCDDRTVRRALMMWRRYAGELEARVK
jgi:hypothetical protein